MQFQRQRWLEEIHWCCWNHETKWTHWGGDQWSLHLHSCSIVSLFFLCNKVGCNKYQSLSGHPSNDFCGKALMICQMLLLKGFTRRWSSTSSANDYDDFSGSVSALPSVQFFILQYGRRFSMIFSNTSQVQVTLHQQSEQKKFYPWCWKTKQKAGFLGRISRRKIWKIMFPEWWELRAACCSRLQLETYKDVAGTITIGLRGLESSIPFESQTTSDNRIPHWFLGRYRFVPKLSAPRILWWHQCSLGQWVPGIENLRNPRRRLVAWNRCIP